MRFAFQPLYSLHTGSAVAVEALARPSTERLSDLLGRALRQGRLIEADVDLAAGALLDDPGEAGLPHLPVHLNVTARTVAAPPESLQPVFDALNETLRRPGDVVLEIGPPFHGVAPGALIAGIQALSATGFRLAFDGLGAGDLPLNLVTESHVDLLKLDRSTLHLLPESPATVALVESLLQFAARTDLRVVATGIDTEAQFDLVRQLGIGIVQGRLFAPEGPLRVPEGGVALPVVDTPIQVQPLSTTAEPRVKDYLRPAVTLPAGATCDEVRTVLIEADAPSSVVGLDEHSRPLWTIDRTRFLLAVTGPFGHALHANRPAARLADEPHVIPNTATVLELLDLVTEFSLERTGDDVVVVDAANRCQGIVQVNEVVRGLAEAKVEQAASLNPLTRLSGTDTIAREIDRRLAAGQSLVAGWLDIDSFKEVNDTAGFAAGDDLIRAVGAKLTTLSAGVGGVTIGHVGGDDFLIVCDLDKITALADQVLSTQWRAGDMPVTVSLATLVCASASAESYREISRQLVPLKTRAKQVKGSSWVNSWPGSEHIEILRGVGRGDAGEPRDERTVPRLRPAPWNGTSSRDAQ